MNQCPNCDKWNDGVECSSCGVKLFDQIEDEPIRLSKRNKANIERLFDDPDQLGKEES